MREPKQRLRKAGHYPQALQELRKLLELDDGAIEHLDERLLRARRDPVQRPRVISEGAGPPCVVRTVTKCAGLMMRCRSASL